VGENNNQKHLTKKMENLSIYNKVRNVPAEAKKTIGGGRLKGFTDINPMWRIKTLTEQFGVCGFGWYYDIVSQETKTGANGEIAAFVTINLYVKIGDEWSKPIQGLGGSMFVSNESKGAYNSDECFKMALTDAIGIACKSLGIAADVYFEKDRTKYDQQEQKPEEKETEKIWLNKWKDKEKKNVLPFYTKVVLNAREKSMTAFDFKKYYKISKEVESELIIDLG